jgi:hypothetical protein
VGRIDLGDGHDSQKLASIAALTLLSAVADAGSAPKELYGKSIIISWTEHQSWRPLGQADFRDINVPLSRKIYVGTKGQWFHRFASVRKGYEGGPESVGASRTDAGSARQTQFSGRTMTMTDATSGGLARKTTVEFNESFTTCEARVIFAKQAGSEVVVGVNLYTGQPIEIRSATVTSGPSCTVRDGNVFAQ